MKDKYIAIAENYEKQLVKLVNEKIQDGYQPYGNVAIAFNQDGKVTTYIQIMMLKE